MKSVDGEPYRLLVFHSWPVYAFTRVHLSFFFFYPAGAYVCLSVWALHEPNGGSRAEWDRSCLRSLWAGGRARQKFIAGQAECVRGGERVWHWNSVDPIPSPALGDLLLSCIFSPCGSFGFYRVGVGWWGWEVVTGKASWIGSFDIKLVLKGVNVK